MKHILFSFVIVMITILVNKNEMKAQSSGNLLMDAIVTSMNANGKIDDAFDKDEKTDISEKAIRHFEHSYRKAANVKWMVLKDGFLARFTSNDVIQRVFYYSNGNLAGTLKGYTGDLLSYDIKSMVRENYPSYKIVYTNEAAVVEVPGSPTYIITLQGKKDLKVIRMCDEEMDVMFDSNKQPKNPERF